MDERPKHLEEEGDWEPVYIGGFFVAALSGFVMGILLTLIVWWLT